MQQIRKGLRNDLTSVILPLVVLFTILVIGSSGFLSSYNLTSLMQTITIYMLAGLAQMSALALGQFNLAIGSIGCLSSIIMGYCMQVLGLPMWVAIPMGLLFAAISGAIQGVLIAKSGINPFIITLSLLSVYKGIATVISHGEPFNAIPEGIKAFNRASVGVIPVTFIVALVIWACTLVLFKYKKIGLRMLAVGENARAAQFSGINVSTTVIIGHMISGLLCGIAAIIQTARFASAQISVGDDWMMTSFVVTVLGGTLLSGGKVSVLGTLLGAILMVFINNALVLWGVSTYAFQLILGLVLLAAYEVDRARISVINRQSELVSEQEKGGETHA